MNHHHNHQDHDNHQILHYHSHHNHDNDQVCSQWDNFISKRVWGSGRGRQELRSRLAKQVIDDQHHDDQHHADKHHDF